MNLNLTSFLTELIFRSTKKEGLFNCWAEYLTAINFHSSILGCRSELNFFLGRCSTSKKSRIHTGNDDLQPLINFPFFIFQVGHPYF